MLDMKTVCSAQHLLELVKEYIRVHYAPAYVSDFKDAFYLFSLLLPPALVCCPGEAQLNSNKANTVPQPSLLSQKHQRDMKQ